MIDFLSLNDIKKGDIVTISDDRTRWIMRKTDQNIDKVYIAKQNLTKNKRIPADKLPEIFDQYDPLVPFKGSTPQHNGMYVCYTEDLPGNLTDKILLTYINGKWSYPGSDQYYRGKIIAYLGPLPAIFK